MKEKLPERFDVCRIEYQNGCKGLAWCYWARISVGDRVVTNFGEGTVTHVVDCVDEPWFRMVSNVMTIDKITHKIVEVKE